MRVRTSEDFRVAYKRLKKRHKSLEAALKSNPCQDSLHDT